MSRSLFCLSATDQKTPAISGCGSADCKQFNNKGSFEGWIRRIIVNTALEKFRDKNYLFAVNMSYEYDPNEKRYDHIISELSAKDCEVPSRSL